MSPQTQVLLAPFRRRARAREVERYLQGRVTMPPWTEGVRVERAGLFQYVIVATSHRGH
jgi:hypothetical protein